MGGQSTLSSLEATLWGLHSDPMLYFCIEVDHQIAPCGKKVAFISLQRALASILSIMAGPRWTTLWTGGLWPVLAHWPVLASRDTDENSQQVLNSLLAKMLGLPTTRERITQPNM